MQVAGKCLPEAMIMQNDIVKCPLGGKIATPMRTTRLAWIKPGKELENEICFQSTLTEYTFIDTGLHVLFNPVTALFL